ncbi:MAG: hypothetical protein KUF79_09080 [Candidatus Thiodiazotropha sp. (ex Ctena orbiculata)]|nr:hypothetical protein [Candidatus Thiodiazotropha taylori]
MRPITRLVSRSTREYQTAIARVAPNKIIIIPPKDKTEWEYFREKANAMTLPMDTQHADLIALHTNGIPHLIWRMNQEKPWWDDAQLIQRLLFKASF